MAKHVSEGKCNLCNGIFSKQAITKHLKSCTQHTSETSSKKQGARGKKGFHLLVEGRYLPDYWMHIEVPADATLKTLDGFLRQVWLECCGHMSMFTIEGTNYSVAPMAEYDEKGMNARLSTVLHPKIKFFHEYDFGTTTHLKLKVVSEQEQITDKSIQVLASNTPPQIPCTFCGKNATQVCTECIWDGQGWLCDDCAPKHPCDEEMFLPVVNSPRVGMCGYTG